MGKKDFRKGRYIFNQIEVQEIKYESRVITWNKVVGKMGSGSSNTISDSITKAYEKR